VPSRDPVKTKCECFFEEEVELHEIVAEDIRIGRSSERILTIDIVHDPLLILLPIVERIEWETKICGNFFGFFKISECRTGTRMFLIEIVDHESTRYLIPFFSQKIGRYSGVNSA
jgi:hypothetical protein